MLPLANSTQTARADTEWTRFDEVVAQSETIAIAALAKPVDFSKSKAQLAIRQVLKGTLKPGKYEVFNPGRFGGPASVPREFVVFIVHGNVWQFVGWPVLRKPIDSDVLELWGVNHEDAAHCVSPQVVTLAQLKTYLKNKTLRYAFRGDLYFPQSGKPGWQSSGLELSGTYVSMADASLKTFAAAFGLPLKSLARVKGFPALAVFAAQPEVHVDNWDGPCLKIEYSNDDGRALKFRGNVVGLDRNSGEYLVKFVICQPTLLTQDDLKRYLGNSRPGPCSYTFHLKCAQSERTKARELTLVMGKNQWTIGQIYGWANRPLQIAQATFDGGKLLLPTGSSMSPLPKVFQNGRNWVLRMVAPTHGGEFLILAFDLGEPPHGEFPFRRGCGDCEEELLYGLLWGHTRGTVQIQDGKTLKTIAPFSVTVDRVEFDSKP
jgi:hypothetical protein